MTKLVEGMVALGLQDMIKMIKPLSLQFAFLPEILGKQHYIRIMILKIFGFLKFVCRLMREKHSQFIELIGLQIALHGILKEKLLDGLTKEIDISQMSPYESKSQCFRKT